MANIQLYFPPVPVAYIIYTPTIAIFQNNQLKEKIEWTPENGININAVSAWFEQNKLF